MSGTGGCRKPLFWTVAALLWGGFAVCCYWLLRIAFQRLLAATQLHAWADATVIIGTALLVMAAYKPTQRLKEVMLKAPPRTGRDAEQLPATFVGEQQVLVEDVLKMAEACGSEHFAEGKKHYNRRPNLKKVLDHYELNRNALPAYAGNVDELVSCIRKSLESWGVARIFYARSQSNTAMAQRISTPNAPGDAEIPAVPCVLHNITDQVKRGESVAIFESIALTADNLEVLVNQLNSLYVHIAGIVVVVADSKVDLSGLTAFTQKLQICAYIDLGMHSPCGQHAEILMPEDL